MRIILNCILFALLFCFVPQSNAEIIPHTIYAVSNNNVLEEELSQGHIIYVENIEACDLSDVESLEQNSIIKLKITQHVLPKRGKRNGYLKVQVISYTIPSKNNKEQLVHSKNLSGKLRLSTPKDIKSIATSAGISIAGQILKIPGFSQAVAVSKGLIKPNEDQNRLQSMGTNLYKSTPLVYAEKGKDISIEKDSIVVIKVKDKE